MNNKTNNKYILTGDSDEYEKYVDIASKVYVWADTNIGCKDTIEICPGCKETGTYITDCLFGTEKGEIIMSIEDCFNHYSDLMNGDFSKDDWQLAMEFVREFGM